MTQDRLARLLDIMAALRTPVTGCPWDLEQNFRSIAPYTIEEAYEVAEAVERGDLDDLKDELGDLLLQVVFHARMAEERRAFAFGDVIDAIAAKLVRRHPHVFGDATAASADAVVTQWNAIKAREKAARADARGEAAAPSRLEGVPLALPALTRAVKLQRKACEVGFDWNDARLVLAKIREETEEVEQELLAGAPSPALTDEIGDLLFAVANLARHVDADPEQALRGANAKFERRFRFIEQALAERGGDPESATLDEMEELWRAAKAAERA
ncbi:MULTISPECIES: nucleoside triphosphate pyrophosphohydrolase [Methylosinus]|uniref:Nucleoside triphosphate pyrophosphohydrolase n=1 Tax=Methylosinus trichosporium (strain ATCC 35070 / NCIMB 11131 / UNIQEM 75 / OB3b) TaxID=595536 RepID=A0A2D2CVQ4_METT3|nr:MULTISPECIES: nucleoside triphosphate pyrophosphohydrolase [Methylosinus]ATQ66736.1 nucleoside triphosphate pyrophosphohydrolase [Methylosinus trichosporium OB3b]OBS53402.1 nucleoside triphosphate pyrophosphohydrolase [Methylosinus sp. 3S-1]